MALYVVGDSVAKSCGAGHFTNASGQQVKPDGVFATEGMPIAGMGKYFQETLDHAHKGDVVIISAGYEGGVDQNSGPKLAHFVKALTDRGAKVSILGLRETGLKAGAHHFDDGLTRGWNNQLRTIAHDNGAHFAEAAITYTNGLPGGHIHEHNDSRLLTIGYNAAIAHDSAGQGHKPNLIDTCIQTVRGWFTPHPPAPRGELHVILVRPEDLPPNPDAPKPVHYQIPKETNPDVFHDPLPDSAAPVAPPLCPAAPALFPKTGRREITAASAPACG